MNKTHEPLWQAGTPTEVLIDALHYYLGFEAKAQALYWRNERGEMVPCNDRRVLVKKWEDKTRLDHDTEINSSSKGYTALQMKGIIEPVEKLLLNGWEITPHIKGRRSPVQIEGNGSQVYIDLINRSKSVTIAGRSKVLPQFTAFNSFTTQTLAGGKAGGLEIICLNGMYERYDFESVNAIRHRGRVNEGMIRLQHLADTFLENYEDVASDWRLLNDSLPTPNQKLAALMIMGISNAQKITDKAPSPATENGWNFYRRFTNFTSYDAKYKVSTIEKKQAEVKSILMDDDINWDTPVPFLDKKYIQLRRTYGAEQL